MRILDWFVREMRLMCRQGFHGVVAAAVVVTLLLNLPMILATIFIPGFDYYHFKAAFLPRTRSPPFPMRGYPTKKMGRCTMRRPN